MLKTTVRLDGMMCPMCESHVNDALRKMFSAKKISSSYRKGSATLLTEASISEDELHAALDPTGYRILSVQSEPYVKKGLFGKNS